MLHIAERGKAATKEEKRDNHKERKGHVGARFIAPSDGRRRSSYRKERKVRKEEVGATGLRLRASGRRAGWSPFFAARCKKLCARREDFGGR